MDLNNNNNNENNLQNSSTLISDENKDNMNINGIQEQISNNFDDMEILNINQLLISDLNNQQQNNSSYSQTKLFNIKEYQNSFYIENSEQFGILKIPKSFDQKICIVENDNEFKNINPVKTYQVDSIIGIFDINDNKYLGVISSSTKIANIMDSQIYTIGSIDLIKITNNKESLSDINLIQYIKILFSTGNFYYSNSYNLSLSLYNQSIMNNSNDIKKANSKFLINNSLLKYFIDNNIPEFFYSFIIFGCIGYYKDIILDDRINLDIIYIERYFKQNIIINKDIPGYIKQIELISVFKNRYNKYLEKIFSYISYISSESMNNINKFLPFKSILIDEFRLHNDIICIINNINKVIDNIKINDVITKYNKKLLDDKISLIDYTSDWNNILFFDTKNDSNRYIDFYLNESEDNLQHKVFWFIDINNSFFNDNTCLNALIRIMWKVIQKQINFIKLNINIGLFEKDNNSAIFNKFCEMILKNQNDVNEIKKLLLIKNREKNQEIINKFFSFTNNNDEVNNSINIDNNDKDNNDIKKLRILSMTWNIAGISSKNYKISDLFTKNIFYDQNNSPDIIVIAFQEIVKLNFTNIVLVSNQESVNAWTDNLKSTIKKIFPNENYIELKSLSLVGIFLIVFVKNDLNDNIFLLDNNVTKTGMYGTLGNKGFFTTSFQCYDKIISLGSGHFEAGQSKNAERVDTLTQLLNKPINIQEDELITFKDADYWIILGDLNFRIELSYETAISYIQEKNYDVLYEMDQFNSALKNNKFLENNISEKKINFDPTYKYEKESNEYAYDEEKIRVPAWTDRILFCKKNGIKMLSYDCIKSIRYSDHRPVVGTFEIIVNPSKAKNSKKINNNKSIMNFEIIDLNDNKKGINKNDIKEENLNNEQNIQNENNV